MFVLLEFLEVEGQSSVWCMIYQMEKYYGFYIWHVDDL